MSREDRIRYRDFLHRELPNRLINEIHSGISKSQLLTAVRAQHTEVHYREFSNIVQHAVWEAFEAVLPSMLPGEGQNSRPPAPTVPSPNSVQQSAVDISEAPDLGDTEAPAGFLQDSCWDSIDWSQMLAGTGSPPASFQLTPDASGFAGETSEDSSFQSTSHDFNGSGF